MYTKLTLAEIERALTTAWLGRPTYYWPTLGSTMDEARRLAEEKSPDRAPEGLMVIADEQTAGRGRHERRWWAPAGTSLLFSLVFHPPLLPHQSHRLTMICSLSVCDAIAQVSGLEARIKWPNDVLIGERKVCGILTELDLRGDQVAYAIVGIGLNVNVDFSGAPALIWPATSLLMECGRSISRLELLDALLVGIERRYAALAEGHSFHDEWARRMATLGRVVQVTEGEDSGQGLAIGVDEDGALLLQSSDGKKRRVLSGDVSLHPHEERL